MYKSFQRLGSEDSRDNRVTVRIHNFILLNDHEKKVVAIFLIDMKVEVLAFCLLRYILSKYIH